MIIAAIGIFVSLVILIWVFFKHGDIVGYWSNVKTGALYYIYKKNDEWFIRGLSDSAVKYSLSVITLPNGDRGMFSGRYIIWDNGSRWAKNGI